MDICTHTGILYMKNKKTIKKQPLNEEQIINEFIGKLATAIFNNKAKKLSKNAFSDPRLANLFDKYVEDTKKFKEELKRLGLTSREDLKNAINNNPRLEPFVDY